MFGRRNFVVFLQICWILSCADGQEEGSRERNTTTEEPKVSGMDTRFATDCTTPNNDMGYCISFQKCPTLYQQLQNPDAHEFLRNSSCGPSNENRSVVMVCCGKHGNFNDRLPQEKNFLPTDCGKSPIAIPNRIFGGVHADFGEFPWMARLMHLDKNGYESIGCAGFVIHRRFVLTAAHCVKPKLIEILGPIDKIILGEYDTTTNPDCSNNNSTCAPEIELVDIKAPIPHPGYNQDSRSQDNDIAIIPFKKRITFNEYIQPICLQSQTFLNSDNNNYVVTGWGRTLEGEASTIKMKVELPTFDFERCQTQYKPLRVYLVPSQICAGGMENEDSCAGDSGGPLMRLSHGRWYASGVVSFGVSCGKKDWPAVYTFIPKYIDWINSKISEVNKKSSSLKLMNRS